MNNYAKDYNELMPFYIAAFGGMFLVLLSNFMSKGSGALVSTFFETCTFTQYVEWGVLMLLSIGMMFVVRMLGSFWYKHDSIHYKAFMIGLYVCTGISLIYFLAI